LRKFAFALLTFLHFINVKLGSNYFKSLVKVVRCYEFYILSIIIYQISIYAEEKND